MYQPFTYPKRKEKKKHMCQPFTCNQKEKKKKRKKKEEAYYQPFTFIEHMIESIY